MQQPDDKWLLKAQFKRMAVCVCAVCVNIGEREWEKREATEWQPTPTDLLFVELHEENIYFGELAKGRGSMMVYFIT